MPKFTSTAIANAFLEKPGALGRLTQMHLQKLTYFAHGWNLAINDQPLVADSAVAWDYGPVFPWLYRHSRYYGSGPVERLIAPGDADQAVFFLAKENQRGEPYKADLSDPEKAVIEHVWNKYGQYDAIRLSSATHQPSTPWFKTYFERGKNSPIPDRLIREHYLELAEAGQRAQGEQSPEAIG